MLVNYDRHLARSLRALKKFRWLLRKNHCAKGLEPVVEIAPRDFVRAFLTEYPHALTYADFLMKYAKDSWLVFTERTWSDRSRIARQSFLRPF